MLLRHTPRSEEPLLGMAMMNLGALWMV